MKINSAAKNTAVIAVMSAILALAKFALSFIPNIEIVTPLIIIFTCVYGFKRTVFAALVFCLLDNFLYSFSYLVTIQYFFHWPLLCAVSALTFRIFKENEFAFALMSVLMNLLFWIETPAINAIFCFSVFLPTLIAGIPFMLPMAAGGFVFTLLGFKPLYNILLKTVCYTG